MAKVSVFQSKRAQLEALGASVQLAGKEWEDELERSREAMRPRRPLRAKVKQIVVPDEAKLATEPRIRVRVLVSEAGLEGGDDAGTPLEDWFLPAYFVELVVNGIKLGDLELERRPLVDDKYDLTLSGTLREARDLPLLRSPPLSVKATFRRYGSELQVEGFEVSAPSDAAGS
jgi:hypothetical protein